eukprot:9420810-Prorocentrum_lima.AAC.1
MMHTIFGSEEDKWDIQRAFTAVMLHAESAIKLAKKSNYMNHMHHMQLMCWPGVSATAAGGPVLRSTQYNPHAA